MAGPSHILVVDGDDPSRILIRLVLTESFPEARVQSVGDALSFAEALADGGWRSVVYDPTTCGWATGPQLVEVLRRRHPKAHIVAWSEVLGPREVKELLQAGADDIFTKDPRAIVDLPRHLAPESPPRRESGAGDLPAEPSPAFDVPPRKSPPKSRGAEGGGVESVQAPDQAATERPVAADRPDLDPLTVMHDLKEPLRTIHLLLERCDRRHHDELPSEARGLIQWAQRSAQQLSSQLDEWNAELSGVTEGEPLADANETLTDALRQLSALGEESGAEVSTGALPVVRVPPTALRRIFENLLANAMRHRGSQTPEIHVGAQVLKDEVVFTIKDNGPGIPESLRHRIFEPGVRGPGGGAGLGLYGTRRLVERWGGQIWFDSGLDTGTTFFVRLPRVATDVPRDRGNGAKN